MFRFVLVMCLVQLIATPAGRSIASDGPPIRHEKTRTVLEGLGSHGRLVFAVNGDEVFTGNAQANVAKATNCGVVYVHRYQVADGWSRVDVLTARPPARRQGFGESVATDGDVLAVGAPHDDVGGAIYVFERATNGRWQFTTRLVAVGAPRDAWFGRNVAVTNGVIVVAAIRASPYITHQGGALYVFERFGDSWTQAAQLVAEDSRQGERLGWDMLRIDNNTIVAACLGGGSLDRVCVFARTGSSGWGFVQELDLETDPEYHVKLSGIALDDDQIIVTGSRKSRRLRRGRETTHRLMTFKRSPDGAEPWRRVDPSLETDALFFQPVVEGDVLVIRSVEGPMARVLRWQDDGWRNILDLKPRVTGEGTGATIGLHDGRLYEATTSDPRSLLIYDLQ